MRQEFRSERREAKELANYAVCFAAYQLQIEIYLKELTDKPRFEEALHNFSTEPTLSLYLESVESADSGITLDQAQQILVLMDEFMI